VMRKGPLATNSGFAKRSLASIDNLLTLAT